MMRAKVSVIIPVYNVQDVIAKCLDSVVGQSLHDIEIVVVDDGTPDSSMSVVERFAADDDRFRLIAHEKNRGLMQARRTGYLAAGGDYVLFCDSDDYLPADAVEKLFREAERTDADVVSGDMVMVYPDSGAQHIRTSLLSYGSDRISVYKSLLKGEYHHNLCGKIFRRELLQEHPYTTIEHFTNGEDGYLFYQVVEHVGKVTHLGQPVYFYLQNSQSSSKNRYGRKAVRSICLLNQLRESVAEKYPELRKYAQTYISRVVCGLYANGYDKDAGLDEYVKECSLSKYSSSWSVFRYQSLGEAFRLFAKRVVTRRRLGGRVSGVQL